MMSHLRLIVLISLSGGLVFVPGWVHGSSQENITMNGPEPDWMKEMPPRGSKEYLEELRRRVAQGSLVRFRCVFRQFREIGGSRFGLDSEGEITWATTILRIISPEKYAGWTVAINHGSMPSADSCWRREGCVMEFGANERVVEAQHARILGFTTVLYKEELESVTTTTPSPTDNQHLHLLRHGSSQRSEKTEASSPDDRK